MVLPKIIMIAILQFQQYASISVKDVFQEKELECILNTCVI